MTDEHAYADVDPLVAAEAALHELRDALHLVGITLPSLGLDLMSYTDRDPDPLIALGRCNRQTARRLAAVLRHRAGTVR